MKDDPKQPVRVSAPKEPRPQKQGFLDELDELRLRHYRQSLEVAPPALRLKFEVLISQISAGQ